MPYSFVWLYLIKYVSHTQFLLIKHKNIFECFNCFWKVFCFCKNFKNSVALFWRLGCGSIKSRAYIEVFGNSLVGQRPSYEKDLEKFSKILSVSSSHDSVGNLFASGSSSCDVIQKFLRPPSRLPHGCAFQSQKTLRKFFKNFVSKVFGGLTWRLVRDLILSQKTHVLRSKDNF